MHSHTDMAARMDHMGGIEPEEMIRLRTDGGGDTLRPDWPLITQPEPVAGPYVAICSDCGRLNGGLARPGDLGRTQ